MMSLYILLVTFLLSGCNKPNHPTPPLPEPPDNGYQPIIIWESEITNNGNFVSSINPILVNDLIITSSQSYSGYNDNKEMVLAFDKDSGNKQWEWEDYIRPGNQTIGLAEGVALIDNTLLISSAQDNYAININSGTTIWATETEEGRARISTFGTKVFHVARYGNSPRSDSAKTFMCDYSNGQWQEIYKISGVDYNPALYLPVGYINEEGDTLLIFQNQGITFNPSGERVDLHCYNLTQDSLLWYKPNFTPSGSSNIRAPIVEGDLVYFGGKWDFYCIDILSGEVIWTHNFYWDYQGSNFLIYNDLIITNLDNGDLIAIDKNSGEQVWVNEALSGCCVELRIYGDRIYFGNSDLFIVEANTGDLLYKFDSPHNGRFDSGIAVDIENKKMYASDGHFFMCMELPE